jgi:predicted DNA-binding ribbon-helix-helix protein
MENKIKIKKKLLKNPTDLKVLMRIALSENNAWALKDIAESREITVSHLINQLINE